MILLAASLFFTTPAPLEMPRAEAYLVKGKGYSRLEDRFVRSDLWMSQTMTGRWIDETRGFTLARLDTIYPAVGAADVVTRSEYRDSAVRLHKKDLVNLRIAIENASPVPIAPFGRPPRQLPRGYADVDYWQMATNTSAIVCAFLPEKSPTWYLAIWELAESDDFYEKINQFESQFLDKEYPAFAEREKNKHTPDKTNRKRKIAPTERELLQADARHSVSAYLNWHVSESQEFSVLDDLAASCDFVRTLTNEIPRLQKAFAETIPTPIDTSNVLCVARIYATRDEYLDAVGDDMGWTAAYWCPTRRELVAHLPASGEKELLRMMRHESFHQYLSYALGFASASPWFNEGYAQYFEDTEDNSWGSDFVLTPERIVQFSRLIECVMAMDYESFYAGTDAERRFRYRLVWSIVRFIEKGCPNIRFRPFEKLKRDYVDAILAGRDMQAATEEVLGNEDRRKLFVREWIKYWTGR